MAIEIFKFEQDERKYTVVKGAHVYEHRHEGKFHRDEFMDVSRYKTIILMAMKNGLTSFRGKNTVIGFYDYNERPYSILVALDESNQIFVISVYKGRRGNSIQSGFIKEHNRINLLKYTLPYMAPEVRKKQTLEKHKFNTEKECQKEDDIFLRAMNH